MTLFRKQLFFEGSKEKLHRLVERTNGKILDDRRFYVDLKDKKLKQHHAFPFRFHCRFRKAGSGYEIQYWILPAPVGFARLGIWFAVLCLLMCQNKVNPYLSGGFLTIVYFINLFYQRIQCIRQFMWDLGK